MAPRSSDRPDTGCDDLWSALSGAIASDDETHLLEQLRAVVEANRELLHKVAEVYDVNPASLERDAAAHAWQLRGKFSTGYSWDSVVPVVHDVAHRLQLRAVLDAHKDDVRQIADSSAVSPGDVERESEKCAWRTRAKFPKGYSWENVAPVVRDVARDLHLGARYVRGDQDAFAKLIKRYEPVVGAIVNRFGFSPEDGEDLQQVIWGEKMVKAQASFQPGRHFGTYVCTVAANAARDHQEKLSKQKLQVWLSTWQEKNVADREHLETQDLSDALRLRINECPTKRDFQLARQQFFSQDGQSRENRPAGGEPKNEPNVPDPLSQGRTRGLEEQALLQRPP